MNWLNHLVSRPTEGTKGTIVVSVTLNYRIVGGQ